MADDHQPTMGELYRLLQAVQTSIDRMESNARADRDNAARTFVRQDVLGPTLTAVSQRITEVEKDVEDTKRDVAGQKDRNRQMVLALIGVAIPALISIILAIVGVQGGVG